MCRSKIIKDTVFVGTLHRLKLIGKDPYRRVGNITTGSAVEWLRRHGNEPFFLWVHYYDPHGPFNPTHSFTRYYIEQLDEDVEGNLTLNTKDGKQKSIPKKRMEQIRAYYKGEVTFSDHQVGLLIDTLEELGISDRTLVILTADHGESFSEHNYYGHGNKLYSVTIHVPLILHRSDRIPRGRVVEGLCQSVDIMPTVLDYLGVEGSEEMQGISLLPYLEGDQPLPVRYGYMEAMGPVQEEDQLWGIVRGEWKYIMAFDGDIEELYNLSDDPSESRNLVREEEGVAYMMREELLSMMAKWSTMEREERIKLDAEAVEALRALGYVQ